MVAVVVLDINIVIYFLEGRLLEPFPSDLLHVSVISEIELRSHDLLTDQAHSAIQSFLSSVTVIELTPTIKEAAIDLRRRHRLTIPDAVIAATAITLDTVLLTNDMKLACTPGLRSRPAALLPS